MTHIQFEIRANEDQQEELIAALDEVGATGFEQKDNLLDAYFNEGTFQLEVVKAILKNYDYTQSRLEETNWNAEWESSFSPVVVGNFCGIRAHFHKPIPEVLHEIIITPKMSFGTGHHATTAMMVEQMQGIDFSGKDVFDFGTGTGILAILAAKMGAANVTAIDNDEWSINNTVENLERNGILRVNVSLAHQPPTRLFDIVLANINRPVILEFLKPLVAALKPNGSIVLSGLLVADELMVITACTTNGLTLKRRLKKAGWVSLLYMI